MEKVKSVNKYATKTIFLKRIVFFFVTGINERLLIISTAKMEVFLCTQLRMAYMHAYNL